MRRIRAAWAAFLNPDDAVVLKDRGTHTIVVSPHHITPDVAAAIQRELLKLKRQQGGLGLS